MRMPTAAATVRRDRRRLPSRRFPTGLAGVRPADLDDSESDTDSDNESDVDGAGDGESDATGDGAGDDTGDGVGTDSTIVS